VLYTYILLYVKKARRKLSQRQGGAVEAVKTTMVLPEDLWRAAKIRAINEGIDLNQVVIAALESYLKRTRKGRE